MKSYDYYIDKLKEKIDLNDRFIIVTVFISSIINYIYMLTHQCLSHDGLFNGPIYTSGEWEMALGRPFLILIDKLRGGLVASSVIFVIAVACICLTLMLIKRIFKIDKKVLLFLLSVLLVVFPTVADGALYIYCFDGYCISMLLATLGAYLVIRKKYLFSIFFVVCSLSLYQAYISMTISLVLVYFIIQLLDGKDSLKDFFKAIIVIFIGVISYFICLKFGMHILNRNLADYKGANSIGFNMIFDIPGNIVECYKDFFAYLFGDSIVLNFYYKRNVFNLIMFSLLVLVIIFRLFKLKKIQSLLIVLGLVLIPIFVCVMDIIAGDTSIIILTSIGFYVFYLLALLVIDRYSYFNVFRNICVVSFGILIFTLFLSDNAEFMVRQDVHNNFYYNTSIALNKALLLDGYNDDMKWMFNSIYIYDSSLKELSLGFVSDQNESYDNFRGLAGIRVFYERYFGKKIDLVDYETYSSILSTNEFKNMKVGSVKIIDNVIVVKTSNYWY